MGRRMTDEDLVLIERIIRQFKSRPTWGALYERTRKAGLPFSQVTLTRNKDIIAMMKDQQEDFKIRKAKARKGLPRTHTKGATQIEELEARVKELEEHLRRRDEVLERYVSNAIKLGVPRTSLDRPLAIRRGRS